MDSNAPLSAPAGHDAAAPAPAPTQPLDVAARAPTAPTTASSAGFTYNDDEDDEDMGSILPGTPAAAGAAGLPQVKEDLARSEISLAELVGLMDEYKPLIPDAVTDYYLAKSGFNCDDVRVKRILALAAQKFIADVATDAMHFCKLRQQTNPGGGPRKGAKKHVLSMDDLSAALGEYGVTVKKPEYYS
ncbi:hypothetical protein H9P43_008543 [Blastocladiella emersonii ATCC 22665]|nr:hypothetical protein H9P43_008543 [Blastocladiella emersonii ATCC 22665]